MVITRLLVEHHIAGQQPFLLASTEAPREWRVRSVSPFVTPLGLAAILRDFLPDVLIVGESWLTISAVLMQILTASGCEKSLCIVG